MEFIDSKEMKISVLKEQEKFLATKQIIKDYCQKKEFIAFDIYDGNTLIGFAALRKYANSCYFLWEYAIDEKYQDKHLGTKALIELINKLILEDNLKEMTTTYVVGNEHAKHIYEKLGFVETIIINEMNCHEVNMIYRVK